MRENTLSSFHNQNVVTLKRSIREKLKRPLGKIFYSVDDAIKHGKFMRNQKHALITVGDRTTINFISNNLIPDLTIIDGLEMRKPAPKISLSPFKNVFYSKNHAGTINLNITSLIQQGLENPPSMIYIDGEEDLLTLLVSISAPLGSCVFYGQPKKGLVCIQINQKNKYGFELLIKNGSSAKFKKT